MRGVRIRAHRSGGGGIVVVCTARHTAVSRHNAVHCVGVRTCIGYARAPFFFLVRSVAGQTAAVDDDRKADQTAPRPTGFPPAVFSVCLSSVSYDVSPPVCARAIRDTFILSLLVGYNLKYYRRCIFRYYYYRRRIELLS